ncbi:MAG: exodeoxyribonuclease VII small subunit [Bacteroidota bacterium]
MTKKKTFNYSKQLEQLHKIVEQLENEDVAFEDALKLVEKGTGIIAECEDYLNETELKLMKVTEVANGPAYENMEVGQ